MKKLTLLTILSGIVQIVLSQSCLPEGIVFTTQTEINSFQMNYPNCAEIEGNVTISGADIINLNGLGNITSIGGKLKIIDNGLLASLTGLENLSYINGDLIIGEYDDVGGRHGNPLLINLSGLNNLLNIGGDLLIMHNESLIDITALGNLTSVSNLHFENNEILTSLSGLEGLTSINSLHILSNISLTSLSGLNNLTSVLGNYLTIENNHSLTSLTGLEGLTSIKRYLFIIGNSSLTTLTGLENIDSIGGTLQIKVNYSLTNLSGLEGLTYIGDELIISYNTALLSLTGLENLNTIKNSLNIEHCGALTDLTGLEGLSSIKEIFIGDNNALASLNGMDNVTISSWLFIINNVQLSECAIQSVCDYLESPVLVTIQNNAPGCNSQEEVEEACLVIIPIHHIKSEFTIYPNPALRTISIKTSENIILNEIAIYNSLGKRVLDINKPSKTIDISSLRQGVFIIEMTTGGVKKRQKLIIK